MKDVDKVELVLWIGIMLIAASILLGCSSSERIKFSFVILEASADMNVSK